MSYLYTILRIALGIVFVFSGYVKAIDPWGTSIKFDEYFEAMGLNSLHSLSFLLSSIISILELLVGYLLVFNAQMKWASRAALFLMLFFTPLTLWLAATGKVSDCGCFGDAVKLTDWETFWKNIVLLAITIFVLIYARKFLTRISIKKERLLFVLGMLFSVGVLYFSYQHLPLIDFRPFKLGSDIYKGSEIPEGAPIDEYKTTLKYEKDGVVKEFTEENFPWQDTTWHFVSSDQKLLKKGYSPAIQDFFIETEKGESITEELLGAESALLIVSYKVEKTDLSKKFQVSYLQNAVNKAEEENVPVYLLTASNYEQVENIRSYLPKEIVYGFADEKMLKTMIRANPGAVLLNQGIVVGKWNVNDLPKTITIKNPSISKSPKKAKVKAYNNQICLSLLLFIILTIISLAIIKIKKQSLSKQHTK